jgi:hypothetical protein
MIEQDGSQDCKGYSAGQGQPTHTQRTNKTIGQGDIDGQPAYVGVHGHAGIVLGVEQASHYFEG